MKTCPFCAEDIQDAAIVCKHCGRHLAAEAVAAPPVAVAPKKTSRLGRLVLYAVLGFLGLVVLAAIGNSGGSSSSPKKTMNVTVGWGRTSFQVTNVNAPAGGELRVYINGQPPGGYRADAAVPLPGSTVTIPLVDFTTRDGQRFNPATTAVTIAWVGGGGFDYQSFAR